LSTEKIISGGVYLMSFINKSDRGGFFKILAALNAPLYIAQQGVDR